MAAKKKAAKKATAQTLATAKTMGGLRAVLAGKARIGVRPVVSWNPDEALLRVDLGREGFALKGFKRGIAIDKAYSAIEQGLLG